MKTNEDYSGFIDHNGYVMGVLGIFSAFTFGTICLVITRIPDPSAFHIQFGLAFIGALLYASLYLLGDCLTRSVHYCRKHSVYDRHDAMFNIGIFALFYLFGLIGALIFLVWNLFVLSAIYAIMFVVSGIAGAKFIVIPYLKERALDGPQNP